MSMKLQEEGKTSVCPSGMELVNGSLVRTFSNTFAPEMIIKMACSVKLWWMTQNTAVNNNAAADAYEDM